MENKKAAVFISDTIKPYYEAVQGIEKVLEEKQVAFKVIDAKNYTSAGFESDAKSLLEDGFIYWASVGPEATERIYSCLLPGIAGRVYSMVLDAEAALNPGERAAPCGVSLRIPVSIQVEKIAGAFPSGIKPGIIYDPHYNTPFAERAAREFQVRGFHLELLTVESRARVAQVLSDRMNQINLLWMIPDQTVISESIIQYIIKQAVKHGIGVIGYNRFFLRQGAVGAFIIDYEKVGYQTADILVDMINRHECRSDDPVFDLNLNQDLIQILGINNTPGSK